MRLARLTSADTWGPTTRSGSAVAPRRSERKFGGSIEFEPTSGGQIQARTSVAPTNTAKNDDFREIDEMIRELGDWRGAKLSRLRLLIKQAVAGVDEELKWRKPSNPHGVPTWSHSGPICTGETYKKVVKLTFFKGASLADPKGLFNSSLQGNTRRAIDFGEADEIDESALKALLRAAVDLNAG